MNPKIEIYIKSIIEHMVIDDRLKERVALDLHDHINEACMKQDIDAVLDKMGNPEDVAREFMDTIYEDKNEIINRLIRERLQLNRLIKESFYEYKSKIKLFGLPLIHVKVRKIRGYGEKYGVAKGIIAIGDYASGIVAIGGFCYGGLCVGGNCLGIIAVGGMCAGLISLGGLSLGIASFGGFVAGIWSFGGFSAGLYTLGGIIAVGKIAYAGIFAYGSQAFSDHYTNSLSPIVVSVTLVVILIYLILFLRYMIKRMKKLKNENGFFQD